MTGSRNAGTLASLHNTVVYGCIQLFCLQLDHLGAYLPRNRGDIIVYTMEQLWLR